MPRLRCAAQCRLEHNVGSRRRAPKRAPGVGSWCRLLMSALGVGSWCRLLMSALDVGLGLHRLYASMMCFNDQSQRGDALSKTDGRSLTTHREDVMTKVLLGLAVAGCMIALPNTIGAQG